MATPEKIKFFYSSAPGTVGTTLAVSSTDATGDYDVAYLYNMLETNMWKTASFNDQYITLDMGSGYAGVPQSNPDFLAIAGHNLGIVQPLITLQYSTDNFGSDINNAFAPYINTDTTNKAFIKEFTAVGAKRYWRLKLSGGPFGTALFMAICIWGNKTELLNAQIGIDPYGQEIKANVNVSTTGYLLGIHKKYTERQISVKFNFISPTDYNKLKNWWETSGLKNFFIAWESGNYPQDVFLMRPEAKFNNPINYGALFRDVKIDLKGRKE